MRLKRPLISPLIARILNALPNRYRPSLWRCDACSRYVDMFDGVTAYNEWAETDWIYCRPCLAEKQERERERDRELQEGGE